MASVKKIENIKNKLRQIALTVTEPYHARIAFEIIASMKTTGVIRLTNKSLKIAHCNKQNTAMACLVIEYDNIFSYCQNAISHDDDDTEIYTILDMSKFSDTWKTQSKKDVVKVIFNIDESDYIKDIIFQRHAETLDAVICEKNQERIDSYVDMIAKYYPKSKANGRTTMFMFNRIIGNIKTRKCTKISFILSDEFIFIKGLLNENPISVGRVPIMTGTKMVELDECDVEGVDMNNKDDIDIQEYTITMELKPITNWLTKIHRLSVIGAILLFYMEDDLPLIIKSKIGTFAEMTFTLTEKKEE